MPSKWNRKKLKYADRKRKHIMRIRQRENKRKRHIPNPTADSLQSNRVFSFLCKRHFETDQLHKINMFSRQACIIIPKSFSISENPEETIHILRKLFKYGTDLRINEIIIDHSECINLEIAASTIMDIIVLAIRNFRRNNMSDIVFSGQIPNDGKVKDIFMASGLARHMKLEMESEVRFDRSKMELFDLASGFYSSGKSDYTATKLSEYIIKCMNTQGFTLNNQGRNALSVMFSEVLNNCEIHGGSDTIWYAQAHYQISQLSSDCGEIQMVIMNFGNTIFEQLNSPATTEETKQKLNYLESRHRKYFGAKWNKEMLYTLFSLQEGISRLRDKNSTGNNKRGTGTIRLLENFRKIGGTHLNRKPLMTITSGNTHIIFDSKYQLKKEAFNDKILGTNERKVIAFNQANDIFLPPDSDYVRKINDFFPGTIISLDFFFDKQYLNTILN